MKQYEIQEVAWKCHTHEFAMNWHSKNTSNTLLLATAPAVRSQKKRKNNIMWFWLKIHPKQIPENLCGPSGPGADRSCTVSPCSEQTGLAPVQNETPPEPDIEHAKWGYASISLEAFTYIKHHDRP